MLTASKSQSSGLRKLHKPPTYITLRETFVFNGTTNNRYGICYLVFCHWRYLHTGHPNVLGTVAPHLQQRITRPYPEPDPSSQMPPGYFLKIHFTTSLPVPLSSKWSLSFMFPPPTPCTLDTVLKHLLE